MPEIDPLTLLRVAQGVAWVALGWLLWRPLVDICAGSRIMALGLIAGGAVAYVVI